VPTFSSSSNGAYHFDNRVLPCRFWDNLRHELLDKLQSEGRWGRRKGGTHLDKDEVDHGGMWERREMRDRMNNGEEMACTAQCRKIRSTITSQFQWILDLYVKKNDGARDRGGPSDRVVQSLCFRNLTFSHPNHPSIGLVTSAVYETRRARLSESHRGSRAMFLDPISQPTLPTLLPDPIHSFYPYPVLPRSKVHQSLLSPSSNTTQKQFQSIQPGPGPSTEQNAKSRNAKQRAARRALMGRRPAGVALGREAEELSDEEASLEDEKVRLSFHGSDSSKPDAGTSKTSICLAIVSSSPSADDIHRWRWMRRPSVVSSSLLPMIDGGEVTDAVRAGP